MHNNSRYLQIFSCLEIKRKFITSSFIVIASIISKFNYVTILRMQFCNVWFIKMIIIIIMTFINMLSSLRIVASTILNLT
jgi:hypothetical protein